MLAIGALVAYILSIKSDAHTVGNEAAWLECDSALAVEKRLRADFTLDMESAIAEIRKLYPDVTDADIDSFISRRYIETRIFDGDMRIHRKSPKNIATQSFNERSLVRTRRSCFRSTHQLR